MMTTTTIIGFVVLGVLVITIAVVVLPKVIYQFLKDPIEDRIAAKYKQDEVLMMDLKANSFGRESAGAWQFRGNGALVLTEKRLHFFMFLPKSDLCIPLDTISKLTITRNHLGKVTPYDLLKVSYAARGKTNSIAWYLTDPQAWKNRIEELHRGGSTN